MSDSADVPNLEAISAVLEQTYAQVRDRIGRLPNPLPEEPDAGGWTARQLLSHLAGAWTRVPVHAGYYLNGAANVPVVPHDTYWIAEWETAPLTSFGLAMDAGYHGCKALIATLTPDDLARSTDTTFGPMSLGQFLLVSFAGHIGQFHGDQLEAWTVAP